MMIPEVLELCVKDGQVSSSWCMCVVSHGYGGLVGAWMEVVDDMHAGQRWGLVACREKLEHIPSAS